MYHLCRDQHKHLSSYKESYVSIGMSDSISISICLLDETLILGPWQFSYRRQYKFPSGSNIAQFSIYQSNLFFFSIFILFMPTYMSLRRNPPFYPAKRSTLLKITACTKHFLVKTACTKQFLVHFKIFLFYKTTLSQFVLSPSLPIQKITIIFSATLGKQEP